MTARDQSASYSCQVPGCGCITLILAIIGFLYLVGALD